MCFKEGDHSQEPGYGSRLDEEGSEMKKGLINRGGNEVTELAVSEQGLQQDRRVMIRVECFIKC